MLHFGEGLPDGNAKSGTSRINVIAGALTLVACLPQSTLFNALCEGSQAVAANFPFCTIEPNMGTVAVRHSSKQVVQNRLTQELMPEYANGVELSSLELLCIVEPNSGMVAVRHYSHIRDHDPCPLVDHCGECMHMHTVASCVLSNAHKGLGKNLS